MQNHIIVIEPLPFSSLAWSPFVSGSSLDCVDISGLSYALPEKLSMSVPFGVCHLLFNHRQKTAAGCLRFHSCASLYGGVSTDMWPPAHYLLVSRKTRESEGGKRGNTQWSRCSDDVEG